MKKHAPYLEAQSKVDPESFKRICDYAAYYGLLHDDPNCFLAGVPIHHSQIREGKFVKLRNRKKLLDNPDTGLVLLASGNLKHLLEIETPLKYIAFERFDGNLRVYELERLRRIGHGRQHEGRTV